MLPTHEIDLLTNTVDEAVTLAAVGELAEGYDELVYGLGRAEVLRDEGEPWAEGLADRYRLALENYCESYLPRWE